MRGRKERKCVVTKSKKLREGNDDLFYLQHKTRKNYED